MNLSNETKVGLGLGAAAIGTFGLFALAVKFAPSSGRGTRLKAVSDVARDVQGASAGVVPMKTMQVTLSMEVPVTFSKRDTDDLLARFKVITDPSCRYLGVDSIGEPWGSPARR